MLTGLLAGCGTAAQNALTVQEDLSEAQRHIQTDPTDKKAREWADRAAAVAPQDPATYFGPAAQNSSDSIALLSVASVFGSAGDTPALADYMTQATQKFPGDIRGWAMLSEAQKQLGQTAALRATAGKLAVLLNQQVRVPGATNIEGLTVVLAQAYFDAGDPVSGAATYKKAIQAYPTEPDPLNGLAYADALRGTNLPEALALAHQAVALAQKQGMDDLHVAEYQDTLGWVQYQQDDYPDAEQNILQAANVLPREAEIRYHLGLVYAAQGNMAAARSELGHAVLLSQGYAAAQQALDSLPKDSLPKDSLPKDSLPSSGVSAAPLKSAGAVTR